MGGGHLGGEGLGLLWGLLLLLLLGGLLLVVGLGSAVLALLGTGLWRCFGGRGLVVGLWTGGFRDVCHLWGLEWCGGGASFFVFELLDAGFGFVELFFHAFELGDLGGRWLGGSWGLRCVGGSGCGWASFVRWLIGGVATLAFLVDAGLTYGACAIALWVCEYTVSS